MSFQAMTWAVEKKCASAGQKLVLLMLANCANHQTGQCNPSHKNLAEECSMGISTLKGHIAALEKAGFLKVIHKAIDGVSLPNQYLLNLSDTPSGSGGVGQNLTEGRSGSDRGVGQNLATNQEDKPGIEPVIQGERAQAPVAPVFPKLDDFDAEQVKAERQAAAQAVEQPKAAPAAKPVKAAEPAHAIACPADVPAEVFVDFLTIRKSKRAPLTNTALAGIRREADKAGLSLADALAVCCERGWVGFRADWHSDSGALASAKTARPVAETFRERDERLARERMASFLPSIAARPVARPAAPVRPGTVIDVTPSKTFPSLEA
jgi:hypothetical protein